MPTKSAGQKDHLTPNLGADADSRKRKDEAGNRLILSRLGGQRQRLLIIWQT
jgi:hypothetical protein